MGGICGWHGDLGEGREPRQAIDTMASVWSFKGPARHVTSSRGQALVIDGAPGDCHYFAEGGVSAAIHGRPRWGDPGLAEIAAREGHGRALATAYERLGPKLLDCLGGTWELAVLDRDRALLAIDRLGVRPLCYTADPAHGLVFGSMIDNLRGHRGIHPSLNHQAIFDLLYFTRIPAPHTIFEGIFKLLPGHYLVYENGAVSTECYWRPAYAPDRAANADALAEELFETLRGAMGRSVEGVDGAAVGAFLSGGIDSSTVIGLLAEHSSEPARGFGVGFHSEAYNEMGFARASARHFGADLKEYYVTPNDVLEVLPMLAGAYDEPFGNSSAVPSYFCARMAREQGIKVLLGGDGGDELFAGNTRYARQRVFEAYGHVPRWLRRLALEPMLFKSPLASRGGVFEKARNYVLRANIPLPDRQDSYNFYIGRRAEEFFLPAAASQIDVDEPRALVRGHYHDADASTYLDRMLFLDLRTTLADDDLRKVGRTTELAGVSVRFPLLDEAVVAFSARLPARLKLKGNRLRYFFKYAMRDFLPETTLNKSKHGFGLPFGEWIRTDPGLQALARDSLSDLARRDIFRPEFLDTVGAQYESGKLHYYGELIWVLMQLELWLAQHMDRPVAPPESR